LQVLVGVQVAAEDGHEVGSSDEDAVQVGAPLGVVRLAGRAGGRVDDALDIVADHHHSRDTGATFMFMLTY
jgi:hypothetical protein